MSFSSITDENTVNILPMYNKLIKINSRLQLREKWTKLAVLTNKNNRKSVANKLLQYEKTLILYKKKQKKKFFNQWKRKYKSSIRQNPQSSYSSQSKRIIWKKLSQKLIKRNRFTYLIVDVLDLFKFRTMKRCFLFWLEQLSYSRSALRERWKYLMTRRMHREVILRIYNVQSIFHTRVIWRDFIDRILQQHYRNNFEIAKNTELIRRNWIFLSGKSIHEQNLKKLYQVKSKLKTRAVWQYFLTSTKVKYLRSIFISLQSQYELKKKKKESIRNKWANLFCSFHKYSHQKSIQSTRQFLDIRKSWWNFSKKLHYMVFKKSLSKGLDEINYRREQIRQKLLLKSSFEQWFSHSVSENKLKQVYDEALAIFVPTFRENSALLIQKIFRLYLKHKKEIHDMIFNNLTFDTFTQSILSETTKHFIKPVSLPNKIWNPLVKAISSNEAKLNYSINFFNSERKEVDHSFNLQCFSEIGLKELQFFSTDKDFPTPQIDLIIDHFDFNDFYINVPTSINLYIKEKVPKFTEKRIQEDVIDFLRVDPEFEPLVYSKVDRFRFNRLKKSDIIEKVFERETSFSIEDSIESSFDFEFLLNFRPHLFEYESFSGPPKTEAKFGITHQISEGFSDEMQNEIEFEKKRRFYELFNLRSFLFKIDNYRSFFSQFFQIFKQHERRVSALTFSVDDRLIKKKKFGTSNFFVSKYSLFQTGIDFLYNEQFYIKGFFFTPRISRFFAVDSMVDKGQFIDFLPFVYLNSNLVQSHFKVNISPPIKDDVIEKVQNGNEISANFLSREIELNEIEYEPDINLDSISFYHTKRSEQSKESIQDEVLNLYMSEFEEEKIQMNLIDFDVNHSKIDMVIEKRPRDAVSFYADQAVDSSILSLHDYPVNFDQSSISTFSMKDDRSFLSVSVADSLTSRIVLSVLNGMPVVSNLPSFQTICEITSDFLINVPLSPTRVSQNVRKLELLSTKDPVSLVEKRNVEIQVGALFNEIQFPLVPNRVSQNFNVDFEVDFNDLLFDISSQYGASSLEQIEANDDRVYVIMDVVDNLLNESERLILDSIPLISNLPQKETLLEISEGFSIFNETVNEFAGFGLNNKSLVNYTIIDDRMFYDDDFNDQIALKILKEIFDANQLPVVPNAPTDDDIRSIAGEFYNFCNIAKKVPLSPIKRIEMKDDKSIISNQKIFNEFSSLLDSIEFPITPNQPFENTLDEIAAIFYDSSDIICYFSGFENIIPLFLYEMKDDVAFSNHLLCDQICSEIFKDGINFPIVPNDVDEKRIDLIASPAIENIENDMIGFVLFENKPVSFNYQRKDDCCFVSNSFIENFVTNMFNSIFEKEEILSKNLPNNDTISEIANDFVNSDIDSILNITVDSLSNIESVDQRIYVNERMIDKIASNFFNSIFNSDQKILCRNLPKNETITEIAQFFNDTNVDQFSTLDLSSLLNIESVDQRIYVNQRMIDKIMANFFNSIFNSEQKILCRNLPKTETIIEIAQYFNDTNADQFSTLDLSSLLNIESKDHRIYVNQRMIDQIASNFFNSIFNSDQKIICRNLPKTETITEIAQFFNDTNVDQFSTLDLSSLLNIESKDQRIYVNERMIDKIMTNIFDSIFESEEKILCKNLPKDETITEIAGDLIDSEIDSISNLSISSLSNIELKDQRVYVNERMIDEIINKILESIFDSEKKIFCSNLPDNETIIEIVDDQFVDSKVDQFSIVDISHLLNIELKDMRIYINENIIGKIYSKLFESIFSDENILYLNQPEDESINEIVYRLNDTSVDQFAVINDLSAISNFHLKEDQIFIELKILDFLTNKIFSDEINGLPITSNLADDNLISEIIDVPEFHDTFCDYGQFSPFFKFFTFSMQNFTLKDDRFFSTWKDADEIANSAIPQNIPIVLNGFSEKDSLHFFDFIDFKDVLKTVVSEQYDRRTIKFNRKDDRSFLKKDEIEALYFNAFFDAIDSGPLEKNLPSNESIDEITFSEYSEVTSIDDFFEKPGCLNVLSRFEIKEPKSFFSYEKADTFSLKILNEIQLPLIENDVDESIVDEITNFVVRKNRVFDLDFKSSFDGRFYSLNSISPYERRIKIDKKFVEKTTEIEISYILNQNLPIVPNVILNDDVYKIANSINLFDALSFLPKKSVYPIINLTKQEKRTRIDDSDFYENLILKILYEQVLPVIPIRNRESSYKNNYNVNNNTRTELFLEIEEIDESY